MSLSLHIFTLEEGNIAAVAVQILQNSALQHCTLSSLSDFTIILEFCSVNKILIYRGGSPDCPVKSRFDRLDTVYWYSVMLVMNSENI